MQYIREPINTITHFLGMLVAIIMMPIVIMKSDTVIQILAVCIFSMGLIGLYGTSAIYHGIRGSESTLRKWRLADHIMIYILIAATYTPVCLINLKGVIGLVLLSTIWILTIMGIIAKILWVNMPRALYTGLYVLLGWAAIFAIYPLYLAVGMRGVLLLVGGGLAYTFGAIIYAKKPSFSFLKFGFHEVFHLFILLGSTLHFLMIYFYTLT